MRVCVGGFADSQDSEQVLRLHVGFKARLAGVVEVILPAPADTPSRRSVQDKWIGTEWWCAVRNESSTRDSVSGHVEDEIMFCALQVVLL